MKISCRQFELELKHPFSISKFTRTSTPLMLLKIAHEGVVGYGEASMVPYMGESYESAAAFLQLVDWNKSNIHSISKKLLAIWTALFQVSQPLKRR